MVQRKIGVNHALFTPQTMGPIQDKESQHKKTHSSHPSNKRCIDIAAKTLKNPDSKISGEDLTMIKAQKRELKDTIKLLQNRENRAVKKILRLEKDIFRIGDKTPSKLEVAQSEYQALATAYENIIDSNPSAKQAKQIQKLLKEANLELSKAGNEWENVDCEFKNKFEEQAALLKPFGSITALLGPKSDENLAQREVFLERLVNGSEQIRCSEALKKKTISWLHGTRSPALAVMMATDKTMHPTGELLKNNIYPLSGELRMGISATGVNQDRISGTSISRLGVKTTISYASDFVATATDEWKGVSPAQINKFIGYTESTLKYDPKFEGDAAEGNKFDWLRVGLYIERLKVIDPDYSENISAIKEHLDALIDEKEGVPGQEIVLQFLKDVRDICDTPPFINPTESIRESVTDSFPIVLAASNVTGTLVDKNLDEYAVKGSINLKKITVAFTESENVDRLKEMVKEAGLNIEVMDFNALKAIALHAPETGEG
ncbi:hypothetical protein [Estrella lausannensis]|uniref:Uncharacterized protein n=1 Tax=Estrella lausannensis TaxID=483423 RepID=A0A0H5E491_9BACT|nr:hypothetical protein [Estrella lausannensis]CRX38040.1 hypothetical protein ELAC_0688 [Estrella lausannensis]